MARAPRLSRPGLYSGGAALIVLATLGWGVMLRAPGAHGAAASALAPQNDAEVGVCNSCQPPLLKRKGFVMGTDAAPGAITVTPIYWAATSSDGATTYDFSADPAYQTVINQYITDLAASGPADVNAVATVSEYTNGAGTSLKYSITAGTPQTDSTTFPAQATGCTPTGTFTYCLTDAQIRTELATFLQNNALPADTSHLYPVFLPPNVQINDGTGLSCGYLGYHNAYSANNGIVVYSVEPYAAGGCAATDAKPNGDAAGDGAVDTLNHEISESITDPQVPVDNGLGWADTRGNENGDECPDFYGSPLGYAVPGDNTSRYNQTINGHHYYTQTEFSNAAYAALGVGKGCLQAPYTPAAQTTTAVHPSRAAQASTGGEDMTITVDASREQLPADGRSTSTVTATVLNADGEPVAGDHVFASLRAATDTPNVCGTLRSGDATGTPSNSGVEDVTNADGQVVITYTASTTTVECDVLATDTQTGQSDEAMIYQGADEQQMPQVTQNGPATVPSGRPVLFVASATNTSSRTIYDARFDLFLSGDDSATAALDVSQVRLYYSDSATGGKFVPAPLEGTTADGGDIEASVLPNLTATIAPHATQRVVFELIVSGPTTRQTGKPLQIETDLDTLDPADGSLSNLGYAGPVAALVK